MQFLIILPSMETAKISHLFKASGYKQKSGPRVVFSYKDSTTLIRTVDSQKQ